MKASYFFKGLGQGALGLLILALGMVIPYAILPCFLLSVYELNKARESFLGNNVKHCMFSVTSVRKKLFGKKEKYRYIEQEVFALRHYLNSSKFDSKHKNVFFILQASNLLQQLPKYDKSGKEYLYGTHSQAMTRYFLYKLAKKGYLKEFKEEKNGQSRLLLEKWLLGNNDDKKSKKDMFDIQFKMGDVPITIDVIKDILKSNKIDPDILESEIIDGKIIFSGKLKDGYSFKAEEEKQNKVESIASKSDEVDTKEKVVDLEPKVQKLDNVITNAANADNEVIISNNNENTVQYTEADVAEYKALIESIKDIDYYDELNTSSRGR